MRYSLDTSNFLEEISSLYPFYCFPLFLHTVHWGRPSYLSLLFSGTLISEYIFPFLPFFHFFSFPSFLSLAICIASSDNHFPFLCFFFLGMVLVTASYTVLQTSVLSSSITLPPRSNPLNLFITSTVIWFRSYLNGLLVFPTFFNFSLNFAIRSLWAEQLTAPGLVFADCMELLHLWLQRT